MKNIKGGRQMACLSTTCTSICAHNGEHHETYNCTTQVCGRVKAPCVPVEDAEFLKGFNATSSKVYQNAVIAGWWSGERRFSETIALVHAELSEALEAARMGDPKSEKIPEFSEIEEELADAIIRIMDYSAGKKLRIAEAILAKIEYNKSRPYKHGKEF